MKLEEIAIQKLYEAKNPTMILADADGTIYTAGWQIFEAPFYNQQTKKILKNNRIPFIIVTGRPKWGIFSDYEMTIHGLFPPDAIITAAGTEIFERLSNQSLRKDTRWEDRLRTTMIKKKIHKTSTLSEWNHHALRDEINEYFFKRNKSVNVRIDNDFLLRITLRNERVKEIEQIVHDFRQVWSEGIEILTTEKLLLQNTLDIFSGDIIIIPEKAGKDLAVSYLLTKYSKKINNKIHGICFGDASIDIPMLIMPEDANHYTLSQYGVHLTSLAKQTLLQKRKIHTKLILLPQKGPQAILQVVRFMQKDTQALSFAQNSIARQIILPFEKILDRMIDKHYTPNDISLLGLKKIKVAVDILNTTSYPLQKIYSVYLFSIGMLADLLDGIRARQSNTLLPNGQLVDVFCDRTKEFYQLFSRAKKKYMHQNDIQGYDTLLAAISCILPSLARAESELHNIPVTEHDQKGGSMFSRTKLLSISLLYDALSLGNSSYKTDMKISDNNLKTYQNRKENFSNSKDLLLYLQRIKVNKLTDFQKKAFERLLLLIQIIQEENKIIEEYLLTKPSDLIRYRNDFGYHCKEYASVNITLLQTFSAIADLRLSLHDYL